MRRRKRISLHRGLVPVATARNEYWSMDFVHDQLASGRKFRVLTVIDKWSRESVLLETGFLTFSHPRRANCRGCR